MTHRIASRGRSLMMAAALFPLMTLAAGKETKLVTAFGPDSGHLWNRVYAALAAPGPSALGAFAAEPSAETREAVLTLLAEFAKNNAEGSMTPLQRAVMQRHLLMHFHAAALRDKWRSDESKTAAQELMTALAAAIRKIALPAEEIRKLPDNYAAALARPDAVTEYDPANPAPFLPKDLLADDGPWIALDLTPHGGRQGVAAEFHFDIYRGSTSFEVRMRHSEGRAAGEAYLKKLAEMREPFLKEATRESQKIPSGSSGRHFNPQTPQFPPGTAWALIHRAVLADTAGTPVVSPLVEGVQIRVYRRLSIDEPFGTDDSKTEVAAVGILANRLHTAFEWTMTGTQPLENTGFHLSAPEDTPFAGGRKDLPLAVLCLQCHSGPGIHSVNVRSGFFHQGPMSRAPEFQPATRARLDEVTVAAAQKAKGWSQLRARWTP